MARGTSTSSSSARTPRAPTSAAGGNFKKGTPDEVAHPGRHLDAQGRRADHPPRVRVRAPTAGEARSSCPTSPTRCASSEISGSATFAEVARGVSRTSRPRPLRRRALHADGEGPEPVRRHRDEQHVRRHRDGPRAALQGGLGMAASGNIHPGTRLDVRAGPRLRAQVRRDRHALTPSARSCTAALMLDHLGHAAGGRGRRSRRRGLRAAKAAARPTSEAP